MVDATVTVTGLDKAIESAKEFPGEADRNINIVMGRAANMGMSWMYTDTPVGNTYGLRNSLFSRQVSPSRMEIGSSSPISVYVHGGTRPHEIRPVRAQALRFRVGGMYGKYVFAKRVWHPGTKPNPFVKRTVDRLVVFIRKEFISKMDAFLRLKR